MTDGLALEVVVTGFSWMGGRIGSVETAVRHLIERAQRELQMVSYEIRFDAQFVLDLVEARLLAGVDVVFVVNRLGDKPKAIQSRVKKLALEYPNFRLYDFAPPSEEEDLHAKLLIADRENLLIGSANLSWRGLVKNHEIAVRLAGPSVSRVSTAVDRLLKASQIRRVK